MDEDLYTHEVTFMFDERMSDYFVLKYMDGIVNFFEKEGGHVIDELPIKRRSGKIVGKKLIVQTTKDISAKFFGGDDVSS